MDNRFIVCHNRDEILSRKTIRTSWWKNSHKRKKNDDDDDADDADDADEDDNNSKNNNNTNTNNFEIFAPLDLISGGTWFGFEKTTGRCAFLTNIREKDDLINNHNKNDDNVDAEDGNLDVNNSTAVQKLTSRGELVINYLKSDPTLSAIDYLKNEFCSLSSTSSDYNNSNNNSNNNNSNSNNKLYAGFNLILFSGQDLAYYSNRLPKQLHHDNNNPISLSMGISYGLSNSVLNRPFVKVSKGLMTFQLFCREKKDHNYKYNEDERLQQLIMLEGFKCLMQRKQQYYEKDEDLPRTGYPIEFERNCSSICVPVVNDYGTRTMIRFILEPPQELDDDNKEGRRRRQQKIQLIETDLDPTTLQWNETHHICHRID